jgi:hypothetical protein
MPGGGKIVERSYTPEERQSIEGGSERLRPFCAKPWQSLGRLPAIYLNGAAYWKNISKKVWEYRIGGYRVIKKLLSYREKICCADR